MIQVSVGGLSRRWGKIWLAPRFIDASDGRDPTADRLTKLRRRWNEYEAEKEALLVLRPGATPD